MSHVLIVSSPYYADITDALIEGATNALEFNNHSYDQIDVPGAFEIPGTIAMATHQRHKRYDGFIALGCVVRGETSHYDYVCGESARGLQDLAIREHLAIGYGILTVENQQQAMERAAISKGNKGRDAAVACMSMMQLKQKYMAV